MPVDNIKLSLTCHISEEILDVRDIFIYHDLLFIPGYNTAGEIYKYTSTIRNLRITYFPASTLWYIENSLHKFIDGCNYTDISLSKLKLAIEELSENLDLNILEARIKKIECGCNIFVPDADAACMRLESYKGKQFQPQWYNGKAYGGSSYFNNYVIKGYNKTIQVKALDGITIPNNLFRWEVKYKSMNALYDRRIPIAIENVKDLLNIDKMQMLCTDVVSKYRDSIKNYKPSIDSLPLKQATAFARMADPFVSEHLHANHRDTYNIDRRIYRKLMKETAAEEDEIATLLENKFNYLLNN